MAYYMSNLRIPFLIKISFPTLLPPPPPPILNKRLLPFARFYGRPIRQQRASGIDRVYSVTLNPAHLYTPDLKPVLVSQHVQFGKLITSAKSAASVKTLN